MDCTGLINKDEFMETALNAKVLSINSREAKKKDFTPHSFYGSLLYI